ncbi:hypothetical protein E4T38_01390 [Aureobasidium subglaciale]|nr:hypothetical protein E4T38_01390 [Aureobasidium subglaciale]KAI5229735.1 hypothetical protein E4T40_01391 [Aureobasidium subglaciale]KAI5233379.1 hypothetical protein E4T41_01388 [Aureobasidium subglaciale]KAI5266699.1 hypothetical protein E4T46_01390 [Aureobasidium subglaciale]
MVLIFSVPSGSQAHNVCLVAFALTFMSRASSALAQSKVNADANPWVLNYKSKGPWNAITQLVDFPEQNVTFFPSLTQTSLFIQAGACDTQDSACQLQKTGLWTQSGAHSLSNWVNVSVPRASTWDTAAAPLDLEGSAVLTIDRIVLWSADRADGPYYLDGVALTIASNYTVTQPDTDSPYTLDVGMLSLDTALDTVNWTTTNGSDVTYNKFLNQAYQTGNIPSVSYGLHVGSVWPLVSGSLILGGYDRSRCISTPIVSGDNHFSLAEIGLEVASGGWPFLKSASINHEHLLTGNGTGDDSTLSAMPNPGVPYLYLPDKTCSAIAAFLPVHFDQSLGHYIWNTTDPTFKQIISSPSALKFSFNTDSGLQNISVPFALLNLTLDYPLSNTPTQYFPCSSYAPDAGSPYHLGRAFLQAAFLGQHGQANKTFLAQAPGPGMKAAVVTKLSATDTTLTAMANPPSWNSTWTDQLKALPQSSALKATNKETSGGLNRGAIAGIVVGAVAVVVLCVIAIFVCWRRRGSKKEQTVQWGGHQHVSAKDEFLGGGEISESASEPIHEVAAEHTKKSGNSNGVTAEMEVPTYIGELEGSYAYGRSQVLSRDGQGRW